MQGGNFRNGLAVINFLNEHIAKRVGDLPFHVVLHADPCDQCHRYHKVIAGIPQAVLGKLSVLAAAVCVIIFRHQVFLDAFHIP